MLSSLTKPVIFAHRGASAYAPENTLPAFQLAVEMGVSAIELDVQLTADQEVVVFHDQDLDRITNGSGPISLHTLNELKKLNVNLVSNNSYTDLEIPTLSEVFALVPEDVIINIELKNLLFPFDKLPDQTAQIIRAHNAKDRVLLSSFNPKALKTIKGIMPDMPCGRLLHNPLLIQLYRLLPILTAGFTSIHLPHQELSRPLIKSFQDREIMVFTYTVNNQQDILKVAKLGVDGIFTDDPALARRLLNPVINNSG
jgi:glycerophosphoryl diester phosphodiesterase